jgi:hypothetical protein
MAKVLTSINLDAPAAPVTAAVNDSFAFTGTPGFTGSGGVQRYDMKWEVDSGGGFVTIAATGTGLTTAGTNPLSNTNSQTANSITVDCAEAGSYTIRISGAPTSGGSYTVASSTQTVEVSSEPVTTPQAIAATAVGTPVVARVVTYSRALPATAVGSPVLARVATYLRSLAATAVGTPTIASASVVGQAIAATAAGVAALSTAIVAGVNVAATAVGSAALSAATIFAQAVSATTIGVAALVTEFIEGAGDGINAAYLFCVAAIYRARRR